ncbi:UDP-glucose 4-epimerase GalE [Methyloversatilis discipulorum]|uniref:UDP-glucose 4-epimerase GalE n=1 Tax=Methyloversatilis discipulorum TaxID=1119528 RepID=UPI001A516051|nr:UDP-glucose 4-epimerase GalE [Methyloversatilis discipulorum]MBL8469022.1 UDP-glucose 4-epimerase GalE [Methyloversatilis discipulorum]
MSRVLVTGGAGYIGSHTCIELMAAGHQVVVVDNLCNSKRESLARVERIAGQALRAFVQADIRDRAAMRAVFATHDIDAVIHFAGLKAVGESVAKPLEYYDNNVSGTVALCEVMAEAGVKTLAFSSSATVYGDPASVPIREDFPTGPTNPYGRSKWMVEYLLQDLVAADPSWRVALLRYFNPVGAHESGLIGEDPNGLPNNLMPFVSQVAVGKLGELRVFGGDWPTPDGTGVRDYIHVLDLAQGHVRAIDYLAEHTGLLTVNLGTGRGYSVLEVVRAFEQASGRAVPYRIVDRRPGDIAQCYADPAHANRLLGWVARRDLAQMCADAWNWQRSNPQGYA